MHKIILFLVLMTIFQKAESLEDAPTKQIICLNMIVKNERTTIKRCLQSVLPLIDYWVIVDTGSTDGTQEIIKEFMKEIPGHLYERPWINFGYNRNEALALAKNKADYILFMDADDTLSLKGDFKKPILTHDFYSTVVIQKNILPTLLPRLVKSNSSWKWYGTVFERLLTEKPSEGCILNNVTYICGQDGVRFNDSNTNLNDITLLKEAIKEDPKNPRNFFFLGKVYMAIGNLAEALAVFNKRIEMLGNEEEIYLSKLSIAQIQGLLKKDTKEITTSFFKAHLERPHRAESLYYLIEKLQENGEYEKGFQIAAYGLKTVKNSNGELYVDKFISEFGILMQYTICACKTGRYLESLHGCKQLLLLPDLSETFKARFNEYFQYIESKYLEKTQEEIENLLIK